MVNIFNNQQTGVLGGLKERFGFGKQGRNNQLDDGYDDSYDEYESDYDNYDDEYDNFEGGDYEDSYADDAYESGNFSIDSSSRTPELPVPSSASSPRLITLDDVKASTSKMTAERYGSQPQASRKRITVSSTDSSYGDRENTPAANVERITASKASKQGHEQVSSTRPSSTTTDTHYGSTQTSHERSAGLNSLFTPSGREGRLPTKRNVNVLKPMTYNDVSNVASMLRGGGVVVLSLAQTPDSLQKRVLDFSFGVASALDAHVDSAGEAAYAITCGEPLTTAERASLSAQGIS